MMIVIKLITTKKEKLLTLVVFKVYFLTGTLCLLSVNFEPRGPHYLSLKTKLEPFLNLGDLTI